MNLKLLAGLLLSAVAVVFIVQNAAAVELRFLLWRVAFSQALVIFFALAAGIVTGWGLHAWLAFRRGQRRARGD